MLPYLEDSWPPHGFLIENFHARHLPLSSSASYSLLVFSWSGLSCVFAFQCWPLQIITRKVNLLWEDQLIHFKEK